MVGLYRVFEIAKLNQIEKLKVLSLLGAEARYFNYSRKQAPAGHL